MKALFKILPHIAQSLCEEKKPQHFSGLGGSSKGWFLSELFQLSAQFFKRSFLIVTRDETSADELAREIAFFLGEEPTYVGGSLHSESIFVIPAWDVLPFDALAPHSDVMARRLAALFRLARRDEFSIAITSAASLAQLVLPLPKLLSCAFPLKVGEEINREALLSRLESQGYKKARLVEDVATFAARGGTLDIFSPLYPAPARIELFGDVIDSIRFFDPVSQLSMNSTGKIEVTPARDYPASLPPEVRSRIKERSDSLLIPKRDRDHLLDILSSGVYPAGSEWLLPFFDTPLVPLLESIDPHRTLLFFNEFSEIDRALLDFEKKGREKHAEAIHRKQVVPEYESLYLERERFQQVISPLTLHTLEALGRRPNSFDCKDHTLLRDQLRQQRQMGKGDLLTPLIKTIEAWRDENRIPLFVAHDRNQAEQLKTLLSLHDIQTLITSAPGIPSAAPPRESYWIAQGLINKGFDSALWNLAIVAEEDITQRRLRQHLPTAGKTSSPITSLTALREGDHVVHLNYGIGCFKGLETLTLHGVTTDFALLVYRDGDKVYVPVYKLNLLQKYAGTGEDAPILSKLGTNQWEKTKAKVRSSVLEMASELLKLYAVRQTQQGFSFSPPDHALREFESTFEFDETPDQLKAIEEVFADMHKPQPMDRLICGDVGFGKTEVAIRAAYKAVLDGKQVALLVPTTLLASQHCRTFRERLQQTGTVIALLSRLVVPAEQKRVLKEVREGKIDIAIGTHRLLSRDVHFRNLGLIIIDEEHRFGVKHKERLKAMRQTVDVLMMTATPIPRTLSMSISGVRDISLISTPPRDRLSIATYISPFNEEIIIEAVERELDRQGQVFFMHNRIETIEKMAEHLEELLPSARIRHAHGQMKKSELEETMLDFYDGKFDLLVTTSIIESGLDLPNANTILINRADRFGLAELYQLRGRVGRSYRQAYAYLLIPGFDALSEEARERLETLERYADLGSGFSIAYRDLEIRGGGTFLGQSQSGHIGAVGFELYADLLNRTILELRGLPEEERIDPDVNLNISASIPQKYEPDVRIRLELYQRLAHTRTLEELEAFKEEMRDRFGRLPQELLNLCELTRIKQLLIPLRVTALDGQGKNLIYHFSPSTPITPEKLLTLIRNHPEKFRLRPENTLVVTLPAPWDLNGVIRTTEELTKHLL